MTDEDDDKPVTLADYIPPAPPPEKVRREKRSQLSEEDRRRLDALERETRDFDDDDGRHPRKRKKSKFWTIVIWIGIIIMIAKLLD